MKWRLPRAVRLGATSPQMHRGALGVWPRPGRGGFSRALGDPAGVPDVISLSYGGCAIAENTATPAFTSTIDGVLAMAALTGVSSFVADGGSGSATSRARGGGTSPSFPAGTPL